ncbi:MAG: hypothetical protein WDM77_07610 [Steroidobacteraceae bacterium]
MTQRDGFARPLRRRNLSAAIIAAVLFAVALMVGYLSPAAVSPVWRIVLIGVPLGIAVSLILRIVTGGDRALRHDLRDGRVESVTGPISKEQESAMDVDSTSVYFLKVGDQRFTVAPTVNEAAPRAGQVRLYYLAESRKVVNLESLAEGATSADIARRPLQEAIVGSWRNNFANATFTADGRVTANVMGRRSAGQWSVDAQGLLHAEIAGRAEVAEASVTGNELRIALTGRVVTLAREA